MLMSFSVAPVREILRQHFVTDAFDMMNPTRTRCGHPPGSRLRLLRPTSRASPRLSRTVCIRRRWPWKVVGAAAVRRCEPNTARSWSAHRRARYYPLPIARDKPSITKGAMAGVRYAGIGPKRYLPRSRGVSTPQDSSMLRRRSSVMAPRTSTRGASHGWMKERPPGTPLGVAEDTPSTKLPQGEIDRTPAAKRLTQTSGAAESQTKRADTFEVSTRVVSADRDIRNAGSILPNRREACANTEPPSGMSPVAVSSAAAPSARIQDRFAGGGATRGRSGGRGAGVECGRAPRRSGS